MAIYRLLQTEIFGPKEIELMTGVYEEALRKLAITDRNDPVTEKIALRIITLVRSGNIDGAALLARATDGLDPAAPA